MAKKDATDAQAKAEAKSETKPEDAAQPPAEENAQATEPAPTIGRIVHYVQPKGQTAYGGHRDHPAIITHVWENGCINAKVFFDCGPVLDVTWVRPRSAFGDDRQGADSVGYWIWPPRN